MEYALNYYYAYHFQTDIFCILVLVFSLFNNVKVDRHFKTVDFFHVTMNMTTAVYCLSDMAASFFRGRDGSFVRVILYISNIVYICIPLVYSYFYMELALFKVRGIYPQQFSKIKLVYIPIIVLFILICLTPFNNLTFILDADNFYHRENLALIVPIVAWLYLFAGTFLLIYKITKSKNQIEKDELLPYAMFNIFPGVFTLFQISFYGLSIGQVGFTLAIILFNFSRLYFQISEDELTGLKNDFAYRKYVNKLFYNNYDFMDIFVCIFDIDRFRKINRKYTHFEGDNELKIVAKLLSDAENYIDTEMFLARYSGDQFVMIGVNHDMTVLKDILHIFDLKLEDFNKRKELKYDIEVSYGFASSKIKTMDEYTNLLRTANKKVRDKKKEKY